MAARCSSSQSIMIDDQTIQDADMLRWNQSHGFRFTHDLFKFPGKFHPPLVEHILRSMNPAGVIDPMAGVGTVAVEAKAAGVPSLSLDIDPVSTFFARVKTTPIARRTLDCAWKDLSKSLRRFRRTDNEIEIRKFRDLRVDRMRGQLSTVNASDLESLSYWFRRYVLVDYARIDHSISNGGLPGRSEIVRRFFLACLISSIRRISLADPSPVSGLEITKHMRARIECGYLVDVFREFERRVEIAIRRMDEYESYLKQCGTYDTPSLIEQTDCSNLLESAGARKIGADLILFSPPYCNAIEYWRRHRLEYLLGRFLDEREICELHASFIGRTKVGSTNEFPQMLGYVPVDRLLSSLIKDGRRKKARVLSQYFIDMRDRLQVFRDFLPVGGFCVLVVGDSVTGAKRIPTAKTLAWIGADLGFDHLKTTRYKIKNRVMQFPIKSNAKIESESILVLQKV